MITTIAIITTMIMDMIIIHDHDHDHDHAQPGAMPTARQELAGRAAGVVGSRPSSRWVSGPARAHHSSRLCWRRACSGRRRRHLRDRARHRDPGFAISRWLVGGEQSPATTLGCGMLSCAASSRPPSSFPSAPTARGLLVRARRLFWPMTDTITTLLHRRRRSAGMMLGFCSPAPASTCRAGEAQGLLPRLPR